MTCNNLKIVTLIAVCITISCGGGGSGSGYDPDDTANYLLVFESTWSEETHPFDFPANPQFSGLAGVVHNEKVFPWKEGGLASDGVKQLAETGSSTLFSTEMDPLIIGGDAYVKISGGGITQSPGRVSLRFTAHRNFHLITLISKISPSPDWFVGVSSLNLFENDDWIIEMQIDLYPFDAGTDSGETYTAIDKPSDPSGKISGITGYSFLIDGKVQKLGTFLIKRL